MKRWWRDWKRGWSDDDREMVLIKMTGTRAGDVVYLTAREMRAHVAYCKEQGRKSVFSC